MANFSNLLASVERRTKPRNPQENNLAWAVRPEIKEFPEDPIELLKLRLASPPPRKE